MIKDIVDSAALGSKFKAALIEQLDMQGESALTSVTEKVVFKGTYSATVLTRPVWPTHVFTGASVKFPDDLDDFCRVFEKFYRQQNDTYSRHKVYATSAALVR